LTWRRSKGIHEKGGPGKIKGGGKEEFNKNKGLVMAAKNVFKEEVVRGH